MSHELPDGALTREGVALFKHGRMNDAAAVFRRVLADKGEDLEALQMLGLIEVHLQSPGTALVLFDRAMRVAPRNAALAFNRGLVLIQLGRLQESLDAFDAALLTQPRHTKANVMRASALRSLGRQGDALAAYEKALELLPADADLHYGRGTLLYEMSRYAQARECFECALRFSPGHVDAIANLGSTLVKLTQHAQALAAFDRYLAIDARSADVHFNRGVALASLGRFHDAIDSYDKALAIAPELPDAVRSRGVALARLNRFAESVSELHRALEIRPLHAATLLDLANTLAEVGHNESAIAAYEQALAADPGLDFAFDALLQARMKICDWRNFYGDLARLEAGIGGTTLSSPVSLLALSNSASLQKRCAQIYAGLKYPLAPVPGEIRVRKGEKIRVGYFSSDFYGHATAFLMAGVWERHDRERFHTVAFSWGFPPDDAMHRRLQRAFDEFIDVSGMTDQDVARLSREMNIDIAVDLKGLTQNSRPQIFAMRAAAAQVGYLGYPCTMGSTAIEYLLADATLIDRADRPHYCEHVVSLPFTYQANDVSRPISDRVLTRGEVGLPPAGFVFCSFNAPYKITPPVFEVWMNLLKRVEGSVLWLFEGNAAATGNLKLHAQGRGVDPARLVFAQKMELPEHLARQRLADLFLDTFPCNAHTTASDALWAGLPLVTCAGETLASRVASSLLKAVGLPELTTYSLSAYEELAFELATAPRRLSALRQQLLSNRSTWPLFDTGRFTRHLESAFEAIDARVTAGLSPEHIVIESGLPASFSPASPG